MKNLKIFLLVPLFTATILVFQNCSQEFKSQSSLGNSTPTDVGSNNNGQQNTGIVCNNGETQQGYSISSAVYPLTCGFKKTKTCVNGQWDSNIVLASECKQYCTHPDSKQAVDAGTQYVSYKSSTGSSTDACEGVSNKVTSVCDASTGQFLPVPSANKSCLVQGQTCAYPVQAGVVSPNNNNVGGSATGYLASSAVYPTLCGATQTTTCQANGTWSKGSPVYQSCVQNCLNPDTNLPNAQGSTYPSAGNYFWTISTGTQAECDAAKKSATCQASGQWSIAIPATKYASCTVKVDSGGGGSTNPGTGSGTGAQEYTGGTESTVALSFPNPTINNISVEWAPEQMTLAEAKMLFRKVGTTQWFEAMPMMLIKSGGTSNGTAPDNGCATNSYCWPQRYSGSIFDVDEDSSYEVKAFLVDAATNKALFFKAGVVKTRATPAAMVAAPVTNVTSSATLSTAISAAKAGDIIQLAAGTYSAITMNKSGSAGKPIVIRGGSGVIVNGNVSAMNVNYVHIEKLTVNGTIRIDNSTNLGIIGNTVNSGTSMGIGSGGSSTAKEENNYIADNVVTGNAAWTAVNLADSGGIAFEGIQFTGPGNVIRNNKVTGYRDCISFYEAEEAVRQYSNDIINNDLSICVDDGIEADSCFNNCRVMRNRLTNVFMGISSQPSLGGHTYFIRNVLYGVKYEAFKLHNDTNGNVILNNTVVKNGDAFAVYDDTVKIRNTYVRNNLMLGSNLCDSNTNKTGTNYSNCAKSSGGMVSSLPTIDTATSSINYQAYGIINSTSFTGKIGALSFSNAAGLTTSMPGFETNSIQVDLSVFSSAVALPGNTMKIETPIDFRIKSTATVVNKAQKIPNVNDKSSTPSIGAYEVNDAAQVYGPRP